MVGQIICIPACPPNYTSRIIQPGDTLYKISQEYNVSVESILDANPGIDPNYLRVGQRLCIPPSNSESENCEKIISAMQDDIDVLKNESTVQKTHESNYRNSTQATTTATVTERQIRFNAVNVAFSGNYSGHYTSGKSYPYYTDASSGGVREV